MANNARVGDTLSGKKTNNKPIANARIPINKGIVPIHGCLDFFIIKHVF